MYIIYWIFYTIGRYGRLTINAGAQAQTGSNFADAWGLGGACHMSNHVQVKQMSFGDIEC